MFACEICSRQFLYKNSANRHFLREHVNKQSRKRITCTECDYQCRFYSNLRNHLFMSHNIRTKSEQRTFSSINEFFAWKKKYERTTHYIYVKHSSPKISPTTKLKKTYYVCHRTGTFMSGSAGVRKLKSKGSNKINASCPSTMEIIESANGGSVDVTIWKTHVGHQAEIDKVFLSNDEKEWLAGKIVEGATFKKIMTEVRSLGPSYERVQHLRSQDVRNIKKTVMKSRFSKLYAGTIGWVKSMEFYNGIWPIIAFKEKATVDRLDLIKDYDTALIIMTEFQKSILKEWKPDKICFDETVYNTEQDFHLLTLFASRDMSDLWYPVSFMITSKVDSASMKYFLVNVKETVGELNCNIFLSADIPAYYDTWCEVMHKPECRFLQSWVVDQDWRENLIKVVGSDELKQAVYSSLTALLTEPSPELFEKTLLDLLEELLFSKNTAGFGFHFKDFYAARPVLWAHCYRVGLSSDSEIYLESLHKSLSHHFYEGVNNNTIEDCINMLIKVSRDCDVLSGKLLQLCERTKKSRLANIENCHEMAVILNRADITELVPNSYEVKCERNQTYIVQRLEKDICGCFLVCKSCNICIHNYTCSCGDHIVNYNICKHIHACAILRENGSNNIVQQGVFPDDYIEELICEEIICEDTPIEKVTEQVADVSQSENTNTKVLEGEEQKEHSIRQSNTVRYAFSNNKNNNTFSGSTDSNTDDGTQNVIFFSEKPTTSENVDVSKELSTKMANVGELSDSVTGSYDAWFKQPIDMCTKLQDTSEQFVLPHNVDEEPLVEFELDGNETFAYVSEDLAVITQDSDIILSVQNDSISQIDLTLQQDMDMLYNHDK